MLRISCFLSSAEKKIHEYHQGVIHIWTQIRPDIVGPDLGPNCKLPKNISRLGFAGARGVRIGAHSISSQEQALRL